MRPLSVQKRIQGKNRESVKISRLYEEQSSGLGEKKKLESLKIILLLSNNIMIRRRYYYTNEKCTCRWLILDKVEAEISLLNRPRRLHVVSLTMKEKEFCY